MISIIIPFYNEEKYIEQCLSSIKAQTFFDYEVLLIDDGSTDSSSSIAKRFVAADKRFHLLGGTHIGFPYAKNFGLDNAVGELITFIDADDYVEPDYLEKLYSLLMETESDISSCGFTCQMNDVEQKPLKINTYETTDLIIRRLLDDTFL